VKSLVVFVIAIPVSVELLGALLAVVDARRIPDARAAAVERLAIPVFAWGLLWWFIGADGWRVLIGALASVVVGHVVVFYVVRSLLRRPSMQTRAIDTDDPERAPATTGIGKGERNLSPGRSTDV
jgi:hypothetical protein